MPNASEIVAKLLHRRTQGSFAERAHLRRQKNQSRNYEYTKAYQKRKRDQFKGVQDKLGPEQFAELMAEAKKRLGH